MPAPPIPVQVGDVLEVRMNSRLFGQRLLNTMHYRVTTPPENADLKIEASEIINSMRGAQGVIAQLVALGCPDWSMEYADVQVIYPSRKAFVRIPVNSVGLNPTPGGALPANVAVVVSTSPVVAVKGRTGSMHVAGIGAADVKDGELNLDTFGKLDVLGTAMVNDMVTVSGGVYEPVLYPRKQGLPILRQDVYRVQVTSRVLRRRTVGVGQ